MSTPFLTHLLTHPVNPPPINTRYQHFPTSSPDPPYQPLLTSHLPPLSPSLPLALQLSVVQQQHLEEAGIDLVTLRKMNKGLQEVNESQVGLTVRVGGVVVVVVVVVTDRLTDRPSETDRYTLVRLILQWTDNSHPLTTPSLSPSLPIDVYQDRKLTELRQEITSLTLLFERESAIRQEQDRQLIEFARFVDNVDETVLEGGEEGEGGADDIVNAFAGAAGGAGMSLSNRKLDGSISNQGVNPEGQGVNDSPTATAAHYAQTINERIPRVLTRTSLLQTEHVQLLQSVDTAQQVQPWLSNPHIFIHTYTHTYSPQK